MERTLNLNAVETAMNANGFTQTSLAEKLGVTKAAVSKWLTGKSFPRPPELLKLGKLVGLSYGALVVAASASVVTEPLVAFRKRRGTKTTPIHLNRAKEMGRLLSPVVEHLPFDRFISPGRLRNPVLDYRYIQSLVVELRKDLKLSPAGPIDFPDLIRKFSELQAVIVPVLWGKKERHENALHVYLPDSKTTWIYLNLDSHWHDFKFWMAHELGHVLALDLLTRETMDQAEDFSDAFAGALLFPEEAARVVFDQYRDLASPRARLDLVVNTARDFVISPNSVYLELENYARAHGVAFSPLDRSALFAAISQFNKLHPLVSERFFDGKHPSADHFMRVCGDAFQTPFFPALGAYLKTAPHSDSLLSRMLDLPLTDAKALRQALA